MVGKTLGHYSVHEKIGVGGMGEVYRATDTKLGRDVALKVLPPSSFGDPTAQARLLREARSAAGLNHPNICTIHEVGEADGQSYIAMELVKGQPLSIRVASGPLPAEEVLRYGLEIADALGHAHEHGIVHRDLKSANVVITQEGRSKVLDFGLAKHLEEDELEEATRSQDSLTKPGTVMGTLAYMAPEQLRGHAADARSDVWALGVVLYEMATGARPFQGQTGYELSSAILDQLPPPLPETVSLPLRAIITRCLEKGPERRYQRGGEVRAALEAFLTGTAARSAAAPHSFAAWRWWWAAGAGAALLIVATAYVLIQALSPGAPAEPLVVKPLTSFVGLEWGATLSPDGNMVAYAHNRYGQMDIFVLPTSGGDPIRLTDTPADEITAHWSPDGRYIAFVSDRGTGANVYLIPPLGGAERKLAETHIPWIGRGVEALGCVGGQPWSPDANEFLFSRLQAAGEIAVWKVNLSTGAETQLTKPAPGANDLSASWSFDGKRIVFSRNEGKKASLWLLDAQGGEPQLLLRDEYNARSPVWLTDNQRLLFVTNRDGPANLWEIDVRSRRLRQVTSGAGGVVLPTVSASGKIAYSQYGHQVDIYWGPIGEPQEKHKRLTAHTQNNFGARVSPDGQQVLYFSDRTGHYELWLLDRRTGEERQLTDVPGPNLMGDWSPDGKEIVFLSGREGSVQPWVMEVDSGRARRISERSFAVSFEPHFSGPRWSPDGKAIGFIAAGDKGDTLFIVDPDGRSERSPLSGVDTFDWYRDSRHVLYTRRATDESGLMEMRVADLEIGKEALLLRGPTAEMVVSRDGHAVAFVHSVSHLNMQVNLLRLSPPVPPDGLPRPMGAPRQLTDGQGNWHVHIGGWSPDGKAIVYTRDADSGDVYMITNYH